MRAGLSTIQQTLTPEASAVLTAAMAEAARRGHGQTTPLHVAATLLGSPAGTLRQACLRSHPTSSHPLQCRALELCFSVALDRLPTSAAVGSNSGAVGEAAVTEPPISNALMAALKRAQAHQRRGCPESQQQPLLAVKVELEQLIVSILDDPGVSRVMREASFSSPAVKAAIESSISSAASGSGASAGINIPHSPSPSLGLGIAAHRPQPPRNLYMNPKLHQPSPIHPNPIVAAGVGVGKADEAARVVDILSRGSKRNPVLVGDNSPEIVMRDVIQKMERGEIPGFADAKVISLENRLKAVDRAEIASKIRELGDLIETQVGNRVVIDLGDLKWLVDPPQLLPIHHQQQQMVVEAGRAAVAEIAKILKRFSCDGGRVYLVGTATCATYLRCQVHHPTMENDWDLQALPIAARSSISGLLPRIPSGFPRESQPAVKGFPVIPFDASIKQQLPPATAATTTTASLCSLCMESYERELAKLVAKEFEKASSDSKPPLPQWLQAASNQLPVKEKEFNWKQRTEELLKRWRDTCARLHSTLPAHQAFHPKSLPVSAQTIAPLKPRLVLSSSVRPASPPGSPVKTDLVLGRPKPIIETPPPKQPDLFRNARSDVDTFKRLYTGLIEKIGWQPEAVSSVIDAVLQSKSCCRRLRPGTKSDMWLMFAGPDRVGKAKMALGLSELLFGSAPVIVSFGRSPDEDGESDMNLRGRRSVNRIVDAIRQNPFSMIVLEDVDRADVVVRGTIKRAIEQGRFANSYGREVSLGSVIFVLTADWLPEDLKCVQSSLVQQEEKILEAAISGWQLELSLGDKSVKRKADWLHEDDDRPTKPSRKEPSLCLDLNLAAGIDDDHTDASRNSSDLTVELDHENTRLKVQHLESSAPELIDSMDSTIIFKPVDFGPLRRKVSEAITAKFTTVIGNSLSVSVDGDVLDRMVGGVWLGGSTTKFDQWTERVLVPQIEHLKSNLKTGLATTVRLSSVKNGKHLLRNGGLGGGGGGNVDLLPTAVTITVDGLRRLSE